MIKTHEHLNLKTKKAKRIIKLKKVVFRRKANIKDSLYIGTNFINKKFKFVNF